MEIKTGQRTNKALAINDINIITSAIMNNDLIAQPKGIYVIKSKEDESAKSTTTSTSNDNFQTQRNLILTRSKSTN